MMNQPESRSLRSARALVLGASLCVVPLIAACGKDEPPPPPPKQSAPPPPPPRVSADSIKLAPKVQFPEERMPTSMEIAQAVAEFAGAIAKGDNEKLANMVGVRDRAILATMVKQGEWQRQTAATDVVRVCVINEVDGGKFQVGFGIQDKLGAFLSAWEAASSGGTWQFQGLAVVPKTAETAKELDGMALTLQALPEAKPTAPTSMGPADQKKKNDKPDAEPPPEEAPPPPPPPEPGTLRPVNY